MTNQTYKIDSGNPNGYIQAQSPAICYSKKGAVWIKTNDTYDSQGWVCVIAETP